PDDLHVALVEVGLDLRHVAELGRAHGREVTRVREEHGPGVADPVVELDRAFRGLRLEVGRGVANRESHLIPLLTFLFEARREKYSKDAAIDANRPGLELAGRADDLPDHVEADQRG